MQLQCPGRNDGPDQELVADYIANMSDENLEQTADGAALPLQSRDIDDGHHNAAAGESVSSRLSAAHSMLSLRFTHD